MRIVIYFFLLVYALCWTEIAHERYMVAQNRQRETLRTLAIEASERHKGKFYKNGYLEFAGLDFWGDRRTIYIERDITVRSRGADGKVGTCDDIVYTLAR